MMLTIFILLWYFGLYKVVAFAGHDPSLVTHLPQSNNHGWEGAALLYYNYNLLHSHTICLLSSSEVSWNHRLPSLVDLVSK